MAKVLVTGGNGYFGSILSKNLLALGYDVSILDLTKDRNIKSNKLIQYIGDVRDKKIVDEAMLGVEKVYHNIAQVPLAKDKKLFETVNINGTKNVLDAALKHNIQKFIYTSSSAVFGVPENNPVDHNSIPRPLEAYGKAKYKAEKLALEYSRSGLNVAIVRPRTIMGIGRLGIFQILFEWIYEGRNIPVLGSGDNIYQFIHADDLSSLCIKAGSQSGSGIYNCGTDRFGSMKEVLENLIYSVGSKSRVKSVPFNIAVFGMKATSLLGLSPLGDYHALMYGRSMYFDISREMKELAWMPKYSNDEMFFETYNWYVKNRVAILKNKINRSQHLSPVKQGILSTFSRVL